MIEGLNDRGVNISGLNDNGLNKWGWKSETPKILSKFMLMLFKVSEHK